MSPDRNKRPNGRFFLAKQDYIPHNKSVSGIFLGHILSTMKGESMKKYLLTSLLAVFAVSSANAAMEFNPYASVRVGYDIQTKIEPANVPAGTSDESIDAMTATEDGFLGGASLGATFFENEYFGARGELEYIFTNLSGDNNADIQNHTALFNLAADIKTGTALTPYITAGIGYGWSFIDEDNSNMDANALAWQVGAGISYALNDAFSLDLGYRYLDSGTLSFDIPIYIYTITLEENVASHQIYLGARYAF